MYVISKQLLENYIRKSIQYEAILGYGCVDDDIHAKHSLNQLLEAEHCRDLNELVGKEITNLKYYREIEEVI